MIKGILFGLLFCLVFMIGITWFLLFTSTGLRVATGLATMVSSNTVSVGSSEGKITGTWLLRDVLINTEAADIRIGVISCDWQPRRLTQKNLHIADLSIGDVRISLESEKTNAGTDKQPFMLPTVVLPMPFLIGRLLIEDIEIVDAAEKLLFEARSLSTRLAGDGNQLDIGEVILDAPYIGVTGDAQLVMSGKWPLAVSAEWWTRIEGCTKFGGSFKADGTLTDPNLHVVLTEPEALQIEADMTELFDDFTYQMTVSGSDITLSRFCVQAPGMINDLHTEIGGDLENYRGSGKATLVLSDEPPVSAHIGFSGNRQELVIETARFSHGSNHFDAAGSLLFGSNVGLNAVVSTHKLDISEFLPIPETLIDGILDISGEVGGNQISYTADLRELGITIREHNMNIGGGLSLHGDQNGLEITNASFVSGKGTIGVQGHMHWQNDFMWEADILLDSFNPAVIEVLPEGNISGSFTSIGRVKNSKLDLQAEIASLYGELSGYELAGEGLIAYRDDKLTIKDLNIVNGDNSFQAAGDIDTDYDLTFRVNGSDLERVFPLLSGTLNVEGTVVGELSNPVLNVKADGGELVYKDHGIGTLHIDAVADLGPKTIQGNVDLGRITSGKLKAEQLVVDLDGSMTDHSLSGVLRLPGTTLSIDATGAVSDSRWHGEIDELTVEDDRFGIWKNGNPLLIDAGAGSVTVDDACLSSGNNGFCTDMDWEQGTWSLAVNDVRFDLGSLNGWGFLEKPISGIIQAEVSASGVAAAIESVGGFAAVDTLQWEPGPNRYYQDFRWFDTFCSFNMADQNLMVELSTRFVDDSSLNGEIGLAGITDFKDIGQIPVTGQIALDLKDLNPLSVVTAEFLVPKGHVTGTVELDGTLSAPRFLGDVDLLDGGFHIPFLGVDMTDVQGRVEVNGNRLDLDLDSRAGEGRLNTVGMFHFGAETWSGHLDFTGSNCSLINRRAINADANPDLELELGPDGGALTGSIEVLQALVEVEKIDRSATESSDVVFVDKVIESTPWPFSYDIKVSLGDDVSVEGFGLTGKLGGNLTVANNADGTTIGRGFLDVRQGSFVVYGSPLNISRGRLSFDGGPVDNPGIDIKASKLIDERRAGYEKIEVGANVIGSAANFEVELYSIPKMEENEILTYILFDNPFSSEGDDGTTGLVTSAARALGFGKGSDLLGDVNAMLPVDQIRLEGGLDKQKTSLVVGKNLSKELSVSYDYNLFKNAGLFRVRYEFGKGFSVESRNSLESNAVELMYSFER